MDARYFFHRYNNSKPMFFMVEHIKINLKNFFFGGIFCGILVLANGCSNDCPSTIFTDLTVEAVRMDDQDAANAQKKKCTDNLAKYKKLEGCTLPKNTPAGKSPKDAKGNVVTTLTAENLKEYENACNE